MKTKAIKKKVAENNPEAFLVGEIPLANLAESVDFGESKESRYLDFSFERFMQVSGEGCPDKLEHLCVASSMLSYHPSSEMIARLNQFTRWGEFFLLNGVDSEQIKFLNHISDQVLSLRYLRHDKLAEMSQAFPEQMIERAIASANPKQMLLVAMSCLVSMVSTGNDLEVGFDIVDFPLSWLEAWFEKLPKDTQGANLAISVAGYIGSLVQFMWAFDRHRQLVTMFPQYANHLNLHGTQGKIDHMIHN